MANSRKSMPPAQSADQMSRVVGLYQMLLRRNLEHFFPDAMLEVSGDRSVIRIPGNRAPRTSFELGADEDGLGLDIDWLGTCYRLHPGVPVPFTPAERRLVESSLEVLDLRFRAIYDPDAAQREDLLQFPIEDLTVARYLETPGAIRIPSALESLRLAALSTYENRRVSTGVMLLGTENDPAAPTRKNPPGAPRYNAHLGALKSLHRICDGLRTLFLVDRNGDLAWPVDIARWADQVQGPEQPDAPCPRIYEPHTRATRSGEHVALVLSPAQEIKVLSHGTLAFAFSDGRWRLLDIPTKYEAWCHAVHDSCSTDLAARLFVAALNLSEQRRGAMFVVLRDPEKSLPLLVAPEDRIQNEVAVDDPEDPDNVSPRLAKRALHHLTRGQDLGDLDALVLEALAGLDGAIVTDRDGRLLSFGAILRLTPETILAPRAVQGARTTAALAASFHGPVLKVSEDGFVTMFLGGRRVWEI